MEGQRPALYPYGPHVATAGHMAICPLPQPPHDARLFWNSIGCNNQQPVELTIAISSRHIT